MRRILELFCCLILVSGVLLFRNLLPYVFESHKEIKTRAFEDRCNISQYLNQIVANNNQYLNQMVANNNQYLNREIHNAKSHMMSGGFQLEFSVDRALKYGNFKDKKGFLTIGIPSVKRKHDCLFDTIDSLLNKSSTSDRENVTIVIMFCDDNHSWNTQKSYEVSQKYKEEIISSLIQVAILPPQNYPDFNKLPRTFNDAVQRLEWRSKLNIHCAVLMRYCHNISEYYIHLEDDVIAAPGYIKDIKQYQRIYQNDWFFIGFSRSGSRGMFFRSSNLLTISDYLLLFYAVQPNDYLIAIIRKIKLQDKDIRYHPSLFQHNGKFSTLENVEHKNLEFM